MTLICSTFYQNKQKHKKNTALSTIEVLDEWIMSILLFFVCCSFAEQFDWSGKKFTVRWRVMDIEMYIFFTWDLNSFNLNLTFTECDSKIVHCTKAVDLDLSSAPLHFFFSELFARMAIKSQAPNVHGDAIFFTLLKALVCTSHFVKFNRESI